MGLLIPGKAGNFEICKRISNGTFINNNKLLMNRMIVHVNFERYTCNSLIQYFVCHIR